MTAFTESVVEDAALEWFGGRGYHAGIPKRGPPRPRAFWEPPSAAEKSLRYFLTTVWGQ
jgi:hypothetical protein